MERAIGPVMNKILVHNQQDAEVRDPATVHVAPLYTTGWASVESVESLRQMLTLLAAESLASSSASSPKRVAGTCPNSGA